MVQSAEAAYLQMGKILPISVQDMTLNHLMARLQ